MDASDICSQACVAPRGCSPSFTTRALEERYSIRRQELRPGTMESSISRRSPRPRAVHSGGIPLGLSASISSQLLLSTPRFNLATYFLPSSSCTPAGTSFFSHLRSSASLLSVTSCAFLFSMLLMNLPGMSAQLLDSQTREITFFKSSGVANANAVAFPSVTLAIAFFVILPSLSSSKRLPRIAGWVDIITVTYDIHSSISLEARRKHAKNR